MSEYFIPKDKNLPNTNSVIRQVDCQYSFGDDAATFMIKLAGDTNAVVATAANYRQGTRINWNTFKNKFAELSSDGIISGLWTSGRVTSSTTSTKKGMAQATITVQIPYEGKVESSAVSADNPKPYQTVTWSEKSTQYEFPLGIYAGSSRSASAINAGDFEAWKNMKTKDITKYKNFQFDLSGATWDLQGMTLELAKKWFKGIEAVDRAYPEVIRTTNYYNYTGDDLSVTKKLIDKIDDRTPKLYYIDNSPSAIWSGLFPNMSWLKSAFDVVTQPTEYDDLWNMTVTEAWIGIDTVERGDWDVNLYGDTEIGLEADKRWPFADVTGEQPAPPLPDEDFPPEDDPDDLLTWVKYADGSIKSYAAEGYISQSKIDDPLSVIRIDFGNSVQEVIDEAFVSCSNIGIVTIPNSVVRIGHQAFEYCTGMISVDIPQTVMDVGNYAFRYDDSLRTAVVHQNLGTGAFSDCTSLANVNLSGMTEIANSCFKNDTALQIVAIPDTVKEIKPYAFQNCTGIISVGFGDNSQLSAIDDEAFSSCSSLVEFYVPDNVTDVGQNAFDSCYSLQRVDFPNGISAIGSGTFDNCTQLEDIYFNGNTKDDISSMTDYPWGLSGTIHCSDGNIEL
jgi:hypothetical protein